MMIKPLTMERFERFVSEHPDPEKWEEAVHAAHNKYDELFGEYFPMTYFSCRYVESPPELDDYPDIGTICLWHAIMDCVERRQKYKIPEAIRKKERDPNVLGVYA